MTTNRNRAASTGVEELIRRLQEEGVARGQAQAEKLVTDAQHRARWIVQQAEEEAQALRDRARTDAAALTRAGHEALQVAFRDAVLDLKNQLLRRFSDDVERLVGTELRDPTFLQRLILEVAGRVRDERGLAEESGDVELVLPRDVVGVEDLRRHPEALREGTLSHFVLAAAADLLREGVSFRIGADLDAGMRIRLIEPGVEIDLTDETVASLLLEHLQPRFRAFLEGIVR